MAREISATDEVYHTIVSRPAREIDGATSAPDAILECGACGERFNDLDAIDGEGSRVGCPHCGEIGPIE